MKEPFYKQVQTCTLCSSSFTHKEPRKYCSRSCADNAKRVDPVARFWDRVNVAGPDDCWVWTGEVNNNGYARFVIEHGPPRVRTLGHRYSYELETGVDPIGRVVMHSCDNPPCVNPAHLKLGTQLENVRDAKAKGRMNTDGLALGRGRGVAA